MVVNCMQFDDLDCDNENGFILESSASNHADIKLPESFIKESGRFRCQIPGFSATDVTTCLWPPAELPADRNITASIAAPSTTESYGLEETSGRNQSVGVGVGVGVVLIVLISVAIVFIRRFVLEKNKGIKNSKQHLQEQCDTVITFSNEGHYFPLPQSDAFEKEEIRNIRIVTPDSHELHSDILTNEQIPGNEEVNWRLGKRISQEPVLYYDRVHSIKAQTRKEQDVNSRNKEENWDSTEEDLSPEETTPSYPLDIIKDQSGHSDGNISTTESNDAKNLLRIGLKEDSICSSQESEKSEECIPSSKGASFT